MTGGIKSAAYPSRSDETPCPRIKNNSLYNELHIFCTAASDSYGLSARRQKLGQVAIPITAHLLEFDLVAFGIFAVTALR